MRPLRVPFRGPISSIELVEVSHQADALLKTLQPETGGEEVSSSPPETDWEIEITLLRLRKEGTHA
jgi:hypothetical protein